MSNRDTSTVPDVTPDVNTRPIETSVVHDRLDDLIPDVKSSSRPKYDQRSLVGAANSAKTRTHAHTIERSEKASIYSYISARDGNRFVRQLHGRSRNALNESYPLPADALEWERLDKQGAALFIGLGGLYPCPEVVEPILGSLYNDEPRRVLDVGCGNGSWAMQMAITHPQALVHGVDLLPVPLDPDTFPPNLTFEIDDINHGLGHFNSQFDLIHMRSIIGGITDIKKTMKDLEMCLRPGGLLLVINGDMPFNEDRQTYIKMAKLDGDEDVSGVSEKGSWFRRIVWEALQASRLAGSSLDIAEEVLDKGPWDHVLCDPDTTVVGGVYLPIGPWAEGSTPEETQMLKYAGILTRQNFLSVHRAYHPMLLKQGVDPTTLKDWSENVQRELEQGTHKMWVRFRFFWTRRRGGVGLPAPPLPNVPMQDNTSTPGSATDMSNRQHRYPAIEMYRTKEETLRKLAERKASKGVLPQSAVERMWIQRQGT